jgi:hypothetical protein
MWRRIGGLALAFVFFNTTGCALLGLVLLPFKLLISLLGALGGAVGVADALPERGPPPLARHLGGERWIVEGLRDDSPCAIVCTAPGCAPRSYAWPADFVGSRGELVVHMAAAN